jgi:protein TonB
MPRRAGGALGTLRDLRYMGDENLDYERKVTLMKRIMGILHKLAQLGILTRTKILLALIPGGDDPMTPIFFTTNREGDAGAHIKQLAEVWEELEKIARVYTPLDLHTIRTGGISKPTAEVKPGCGQQRGRKRKNAKKQESEASAPLPENPITGAEVGSETAATTVPAAANGSVPAAETEPAPELEEIKELLEPPPPGQTKSLKYVYANNPTARDLGAVCCELSDVFLYRNLSPEYLMREQSFRAARLAMRARHAPVIRALMHPYDCHGPYYLPDQTAHPLAVSQRDAEDVAAATSLITGEEGPPKRADNLRIPVPKPRVYDPEVGDDVRELFVHPSEGALYAEPVRFFDYRRLLPGRLLEASAGESEEAETEGGAPPFKKPKAPRSRKRKTTNEGKEEEEEEEEEQEAATKPADVALSSIHRAALLLTQMRVDVGGQQAPGETHSFAHTGLGGHAGALMQDGQRRLFASSSLLQQVNDSLVVGTAGAAGAAGSLKAQGTELSHGITVSSDERTGAPQLISTVTARSKYALFSDVGQQLLTAMNAAEAAATSPLPPPKKPRPPPAPKLAPRPSLLPPPPMSPMRPGGPTGLFSVPGTPLHFSGASSLPPFTPARMPPPTPLKDGVGELLNETGSGWSYDATFANLLYLPSPSPRR